MTLAISFQQGPNGPGTTNGKHEIPAKDTGRTLAAPQRLHSPGALAEREGLRTVTGQGKGHLLWAFPVQVRSFRGGRWA